MSTLPQNNWKHLAPEPTSYMRQLFVKGTGFPARDLYVLSIDPEEPRTPEEVAAAFGVPVEAVQEAIAYCRSDPIEICQDFEDQETWFSGHGFGRLNQSGKEE